MSLLPPINTPAPSSTPSTNNLLRSDWNFSSVAENASWTTKGVLHAADQSNSNGTSSTAVAAARPTSRLQTQRPSSKEFKNGLPPVYSKWLVQYWLYSNRARTVPVDHVNLSGWPIDKIVAGCVATICKRAVSLSLSKSYGVNDNMLHRMSFLSKLQSLDLSGCVEITDTGVDIVRRHFPKLRTLNLSKCRQITRNSVCPLIKTLKKCTSYDFSYCGELTDAILESFSFRCARVANVAASGEYVMLEDLNLSGCTRLTAAGVGPFLQSCSTLVTLRLAGCINVEGIGFAPMQEISQLHLFELDLSGMPQIQDVDFAWIVHGVPCCQKLWLDGMNLLTDKSIRMLCDVMPKLMLLSLNCDPNK